MTPCAPAVYHCALCALESVCSAKNAAEGRPPYTQCALFSAARPSRLLVEITNTRTIKEKHYYRKTNHQHRVVGRSENPSGEGAISNVVGMIRPLHPIEIW